MTWKDWYGKFFILVKLAELAVISLTLEILLCFKKNEALDEYILILWTTIAYSSDALCNNIFTVVN